MYVDRFSVAADISEGYKGNRKYDLLTEVKSNEDVEKGGGAVPEATAGSTPQPRELSKFCSNNYKALKLSIEYTHGLQIALLTAAQVCTHQLQTRRKIVIALPTLR